MGISKWEWGCQGFKRKWLLKEDYEKRKLHFDTRPPPSIKISTDARYPPTVPDESTAGEQHTKMTLFKPR